jgi:hypothetical protein
VAYRNPAFIARHYAAEKGVSFITTNHAAATGFGKERLVDYRSSTNFKFAASQSDHWIEFQLFNPEPGPPVNRLIIPAGHNLSGSTVTVKSGSVSNPGSTRASGVAGSGLFSLSWAEQSESESRYWRIEFSGSGQWELPELWLGRYRQVATGPRPAWELPLYTPAVVRAYASREAVLLAGPSRRRFQLDHVGLAGTDLAIYDEVLALGVALPFWFYAPDDALADPILMRLSEDGERTQDHPSPQAGPTYTVRLRALEQKS